MPLFIADFEGGSHYGNPYDSYNLQPVYENNYAAQYFKGLTYTAMVDMIGCYVAGSGTMPADDLYYAIEHITGSNVIAQGMLLSFSEFSEFPHWAEANLPAAVEIKAGEEYRIYLYSPMSDNVNNYNFVMMEHTGPAVYDKYTYGEIYSYAEHSMDSGGYWTPIYSGDHGFRLKSSAIEPTPTYTETSTNTPSVTSTVTETATPTLTMTATETITDSPTPSATASATRTITETVTETITSTVTASITETITETVTETITLTATETATPTATESATGTITETVSPSPTASVTQTATETVTKTVTETSTPSITPSVTETSTETSTPSVTGTNTPVDTLTDTPTMTPSMTETATQTSTEIPTDTDTPTDTETPTETYTHTETYTYTETPTETYTYTETETPTETYTYTETHTYTETQTPTETYTPTQTPTPNVDTVLDRNVIDVSKGETVKIKVKIDASKIGMAVIVKIYNLTGEYIKELQFNTYVEGWNEIEWDATNRAGNLVGRGIYFIHIRTDEGRESRRVYVIK